MIKLGWKHTQQNDTLVKFFILSLTLLLIRSSTLAQNIVFEDKIYDDNIKSVLLYPASQDPYPEFRSEIINLRQDVPLLLQFDELYYDFSDYFFKIIRANADWKKSIMPELEYLFEYNEFPIVNYDYSQNTKIPYTSYRVELPKVKQTGNYLLAVYRRNDGEQLVLTKRFVVFTNNVEINSVFGNNLINRSNPKKHRFEFSINYGSLESFSPVQDFSIVIRQNQRWDNALTTFAPSMIREDIGIMEFQGFAGENSMDAGNEFRFFDLRGYTYRGQNIGEINRGKEMTSASLLVDQNRSNQAYSIIQDRNGKYFNQTLEPGASAFEQDYMKTKFTLNVPKQKSDIYVVGHFNLWQRNKRSKMTFNKNSDNYSVEILMRQGYYDYMYWLDSDEPWQVEGSYFETENQYELLVYYRPPGTQFDYLVGYATFNSGTY
ncbi:MAG: type IX secretion system plug protein domain-containing protein [Bacteroidota bacterium]